MKRLGTVLACFVCVVYVRAEAGADLTDSLQRQAGGAMPPVILLNGWQIGGCPTSAPVPADTFGALPALLAGDGLTVHFFDNCRDGPGATIEALGNRLGEFIANLQDAGGGPITEVDLVAHSMGGLIARAYLAGLQPDGSLRPPFPVRVRKLVQIATPNFGSYLADLNRNHPAIDAQARQMIPGSDFLYRLATWNQRHDDLRGVDALAIAANGGFAAPSRTPSAGAGDGVVSLTSQSLGFAREPERTRVLGFCHIDSSGFLLAFVHCSGAGIAKSDSAHSIVRSFLGGTEAWRSIGTPADRNPVLSQSGGIYVAAADHVSALLTDLTAASFGATALSPGGSAGRIFYREFVSGTETVRYSSAQGGQRDCGAVGPSPGFFTIIRCKQETEIVSVGPLLPGAGRIVRSGGTIVITGRSIGPVCPASCAVVADPGNVPLQVSSSTSERIEATLPATFSGLTTIRVSLLSFVDRIAFMADPGVSSKPVITSVVHGASFQEGIQNNSWVTIRGTNLAPAARIWDAQREIVNGVLPTELSGVRVTINGKPAVVYYISATQINVLAPTDASLGSVAVVVANGSGSSDPFAASIQEYAPGFFAFEPQGNRYAAATHADGSLLGPADLFSGAVSLRPAQPGEVIVLYGSGFGPTDPPVPSDQVFTGAARLTGQVSITVGGKPAQVLFQGVTSNGLCQFNIAVPDLDTGDHRIAATAGGVQLRQSVFLAVRR